VLARDSRFNIFLLLHNSGNETDEEVDRDLVEDELEVVVVTEVEGRVDRDRDPVIGVVLEDVPGVVPEVAILASGLDLVLETRKERLERDQERDRKRRGLPPIKKESLSVCSTTLWVGHLSKLVQQEELSDTFGQYGEILSIDLIPPRGCAFVCMHRRQDAYRALTKLAGHKLQGKAITVIDSLKIC
jgi:hypothetical protein